MAENTQAVVDEAKASAKPDAAVGNAQKDDGELEALLAEFDNKTKAAAFNILFLIAYPRVRR